MVRGSHCPTGKSLPELGVNDQRYVLYRSQFSLTGSEQRIFTRLLINTFTRDIVSAEVNGQIAKRLYPSDAYAAAATRDTKKSFARIGRMNSTIALMCKVYCMPGPIKSSCFMKTSDLSTAIFRWRN